MNDTSRNTLLQLRVRTFTWLRKWISTSTFTKVLFYKMHLFFYQSKQCVDFRTQRQAVPQYHLCILFVPRIFSNINALLSWFLPKSTLLTCPFSDIALSTQNSQHKHSKETVPKVMTLFLHLYVFVLIRWVVFVSEAWYIINLCICLKGVFCICITKCIILLIVFCICRPHCAC